MALIKCPECGREISDKASFCPGCGCPASEFVKSSVFMDTQSELDRLADEIFAEMPTARLKSKQKLMKVAGISLKEADEMIEERYGRYKLGKKAGNFPDTKFCPYCGSENIESFEKPGVSVTSKVKFLGESYMTTSSPNRRMMRCLMCGRDWKPHYTR